MSYKVIATFRDKRSGAYVNPGDTLPKGLDEETLERLVKARCLKPLKPAAPNPGAQTGADTAEPNADMFGDPDGDDDTVDGDADEGGDGDDDAAGAEAPAQPASPRRKRSAS